MIGRPVLVASALLAPLLSNSAARAQDVPGIEICTVEKTMERRTSCLQSNVDFLMKTISKLGADHQQKLDAANRQIEALKIAVAGLRRPWRNCRRRRRNRRRNRRRLMRRRRRMVRSRSPDTAVIGRLDRAPSIPETVVFNREGAAYWIARSSRATTVLLWRAAATPQFSSHRSSSGRTAPGPRP